MSTWNLGIDDVSEETRAFRDKLSSKDGQIAAQQDRIAKQGAEHEEMVERLNEALHKLAIESQRALRLESDLQQRTEDLRNERIASENAKSALTTALEKNKESNLEMRQLETTLERISHTSDEHKARSMKVEKEKSMLEARMKELESDLRQYTTPLPTVTPGRRGMPRARSSSLSNFKITTLEQDLNESKALVASKDAQLDTITQKLSQVQSDLLKADNDKVAADRKWSAQIEALQSSLEEKEEELVYLKEHQGDGSREEELLRRIEEDDAKIAALELIMRGTEDSKQLQERLKRVEAQVKEEQRRLAISQEHEVELLRQKEDALDELEDSRRELHRLVKELNERKARDHALGQKAAATLETCEDPLMNDTSCLIDMDSLEPQGLPVPVSPVKPTADADTVTQIERLLAAVERLRGERDGLRRDVQFLESESRFAIEALEAKLSASMSTSSNNETMATIDHLRAEMDDMHAQMLAYGEQYGADTNAKNQEIRRLSVQVQALSIALSRAGPQYEGGRLQNDRHWEQEVEAARAAEQESRQHLDEAFREIQELNEQLEDLESDRDSLTLQVTNLMTDLQIAQDELTNAESRYTNLQFHQLNTMTSNEATRTLREHIEELEMRVMRRTEQIGIHQHDIRRLETNLRLQEERLSEMSNELEMMAAQKDAMVEDCADAREARNEAQSRVESLEEELESMEERNNENKARIQALEESDTENKTLVNTLIAVVADTVSSARAAIRAAKNQATKILGGLSIDSVVQQDLDDKIASLLSMTRQSEEQRAELEKIRSALAQGQAEAKELSDLAQRLQDEKSTLETQLAITREASPDSTIIDLQNQNKGLQDRLQELQLSRSTNEDAERALVQLKLQHTEALGILQGRLVETESDLEELQARYNASKEEHQRAAEDAEAAIHDLEGRLDATTKTIAELRNRADETSSQKEEHLKKISGLQDELNKSELAHQVALQSYKTLQTENTCLVEKLAQVQEEQNILVNRAVEHQQVAQQELEKRIQSLQGRFAEETCLLNMSKEEVARLSLRLQEETEKRTQDHQTHAASLLSSNERAEHAEQTASQLRADLATLQNSFSQAQAQLSAIEEEKILLQQEITTHEAEVQKSKSLCRYLEAQIKDNDQVVSNLKVNIERLHADLARSEKACKAAEVNLSLQNAQHKRETGEFQRELSALRVRPNLEQALSELEERNTEMEDLLRAKCAEIEENDDRVLEMLKEKKKLTAKVESLNRKVQNLQAKLAAAKASAPSPVQPPSAGIAQSTPQTASLSASSSTGFVPQTQQPVAILASRPRSATSSSTHRTAQPSDSTPPSLPRTRVLSGPSSLPRPKTPERSRPVFKAKTPERRHVPEEPMTSEVVIGKKRSAPDDFEACENMPVQAFTADGEDVENRTPRVRRVLNSLQSGFTPLRNQNARPTAPMPSPRRSVPARPSPYISDMTNSPHEIPPVPSSTKQSSKRSWLGKIRGSSHSQERHMTSRSLFDRGESS